MFTSVRRSASQPEPDAQMYEPSAIFSTDMWSTPRDSPQLAAASPPDYFTAAGPAMTYEKLSNSAEMPMYSDVLAPNDPKTPQCTPEIAASLQAYPKVVTPQSGANPYAYSSVPTTPGRSAYFPLLSPMDTPLATPLETHADQFIENEEARMMTWGFNGAISGHPPTNDQEPSAFRAFSDPPVKFCEPVTPNLYMDSTGDPIAPHMLPLDPLRSRNASLSSGGMATANLPDLRSPYSPFADAPPSLEYPASGPRLPPPESGSEMGLNTPQIKGNPFYRPPSYLRRSISEQQSANNAVSWAPYSPSPGGYTMDTADAGVGSGVSGDYEPRHRSYSMSSAHLAKPNANPLLSTNPMLVSNPMMGLSVGVGKLSSAKLNAKLTAKAGVKPSARTPSKSDMKPNGKLASTAKVRKPGLGSNSPGLADAVEDEKPHACDLCDKSFRRLEHLRRHTKTHTQERPYPCTVEGCTRRFSRSDNLKAHILTHAKKSGRNFYAEGVAERPPSIKRRKPRPPLVSALAMETSAPIEPH